MNYTPAERQFIQLYDQARAHGASDDQAEDQAVTRMGHWGYNLDAGGKDMLDAILIDHHFWAEQKIQTMKRMRPVMKRIFDEGVRVAKTIEVPGHKGRKDFLDPDPEGLENAAGQVFEGYMDNWWAGLEANTRDGLRKAITKASQDGKGVRQVIRDIKPLFGAQRAKLIGVTETTRLFGQGAQATYRASGIEEWIWRNVQDDRVCPICDGLAGSRFSVDVPFHPAHPGCRCFPAPAAARASKDLAPARLRVLGRRIEAIRRRVAA